MAGLSAEHADFPNYAHQECAVDTKTRPSLSNFHSQRPDFREIGNLELISKRHTRVVPLKPGGTLSDYIPFYFTPHSPMLYNIKTGFSVPQLPMRKIAVLTTSLIKIQQQGIQFVFTDRHAYLVLAQYYNSLNKLDCVDWNLLNSRDFKRDHNNPGKFERYQAEALVHRHVPVEGLTGLCATGRQRRNDLNQKLQAARRS